MSIDMLRHALGDTLMQFGHYCALSMCTFVCLAISGYTQMRSLKMASYMEFYATVQHLETIANMMDKI